MHSVASETTNSTRKVIGEGFQVLCWLITDIPFVKPVLQIRAVDIRVRAGRINRDYQSLPEPHG